jgi:hypothetical protein
MISLLLKGDALGIVWLPGVRGGDFEGPIFGLVVFDILAVSSMEEEAGRPGSAAAAAQAATAAVI